MNMVESESVEIVLFVHIKIFHSVGDHVKVHSWLCPLSSRHLWLSPTILFSITVCYHGRLQLSVVKLTCVCWSGLILTTITALQKSIINLASSHWSLSLAPLGVFLSSVGITPRLPLVSPKSDGRRDLSKRVGRTRR